MALVVFRLALKARRKCIPLCLQYLNIFMFVWVFFSLASVFLAFALVSSVGVLMFLHDSCWLTELVYKPVRVLLGVVVVGTQTPALKQL